MLDKIRLHAAGRLPPEYVANLGDERPVVFDARCCRFLGVAHADLSTRTLQGGSDEEILAWALEHGTRRSREDCALWNHFLAKLGWRDIMASRLETRVRECGLEGRNVQTFFDLIECDEGRDPVDTQPWRRL